MATFESSATYFILVSLFGLLSLATEAAPTYSDHYCTNTTTFKPNSTFQSNLNVLLSSLTSNASLHDGFYQTTLNDGTADKIVGLFLCRGDVTPSVCQACVAAAAKEILHRCPVDKESIIWFDVCTLRYSNDYLNNIVPGVHLKSSKNISASDRVLFDQLLPSMLKGLTSNATNSRKKFATQEEKLTNSQTLYSLAQCVPDLSTFDCNMCFQSGLGSLPTCCAGREGATLLLPSCNFRYELYPFYNVTVSVIPPGSGPSDNAQNKKHWLLITCPLN